MDRSGNKRSGEKIIIYQKPTCTTCRKVHQALVSSGVDFETVNYYTEPIPKSKLKELIKKMNIRARDLFRKKEEIYRELKLSEREVADAEAIEMMLKYPDLIERPIVEKGARAILARPAERISEIL